MLVLEATGPAAGRLGASGRREFSVDGGTIGRASDNSWVLPHGAVSGHHASIKYAEGVFYITDTSTNGVFLNSRTNRLTRGQPYPISSGDVIIIEPFHIQASIVEERGVAPSPGVPAPAPVVPPPASAASDPFRGEDPFAWSEPGPPMPAPQGDEVDPLKLLGIDSGPRQAPRGPSAQDLLNAPPIADHFRPPPSSQPVAPPAAGPQMLIPEDYDPAAELRERESPRPPVAPPPVAPPPVARPPVPRPPVAREPTPAEPQPQRPRPIAEPVARQARRPEPGEDAGRAVLSQVLAGAGLPDAPVTPQLATHLGEILRVVVSGVMDVLRARQQIKDEFRMQATRFMQRDNNALKFSANVDDALHNLLVKQNPAYLGPVEAFEDAFRDLRNHQIAMLAGMRVAFESMLAEFDPDQLQAQFDRVVKKSTKPEAQYWEMYRQRAQDLARDIEVAFRDLFGDRFVSAYQEQFDRLNAQSRKR